MKWKHTRPNEWVSRPFFIRRDLADRPPTYSLYRSDGSDWGELLNASLPSLAAAKRAAEEAARVQ